MSKSDECFIFINENWKEDFFINSIKEWKRIEENVSKDGNIVCLGCNTKWTDKKYLFGSICPKCDDRIQPFLSNPINHQNVLKYINKKYWKYIFPIYTIFDQLDDKADISVYNNSENNPENVLFLYKEHGEYGISLTVRYPNGKKYMNVFKNNENTDYSITKLTFESFGLNEYIYSNRTEYYFGSYFSEGIDEKIEKVLKYINDRFKDYYPNLDEFLSSDSCFMLIFEDDVDRDFYYFMDFCKICSTIDINKESICDFCDHGYCDKCLPDEISFETCDQCNTTVCYYSGRHTDYKCLKTQFRGSSCSNCGN